MRIAHSKIQKLKNLILSGPRKIVIVTHTNPDGDALGSSLAWGEMLEGMEHDVSYIVPNKHPYFLDWMNDIGKFINFREQPQKVAGCIKEAEVIFCLDFNCIDRLEALGDIIAANTTAKYVLIDHHLNPPPVFDLSFSHPKSSSTSILVYNLIKKLKGAKSISRRMAEAIYVGIMTDTGNFSYGNLDSALFRAVAVLADTGIDIPQINRAVYNSFTVDRVKLLGYALTKMETIRAANTKVAYMTLSEQELRMFRFQQGDSEGFVNYPLTISDVTMSAIFIQTRNFIRVSLRSRGDVDVSLFASLYFDGGGHKNAAGGKSYSDIDKTVEHYRKSVKDFFKNHVKEEVTE